MKWKNKDRQKSIKPKVGSFKRSTYWEILSHTDQGKKQTSITKVRNENGAITKTLQKLKYTTRKYDLMYAKAEYCPWFLHTAQPRGWADHLSYASCPTHWFNPSLTPFKELPHLLGTCYLFSLPLAVAWASVSPVWISHLASFQFLLIK